MVRAVTRAVGPHLGECALTYMERDAIDVERAAVQHREYEACLRRMGAEVISLPAAPELPDSVFVEDTAVVTDEVAVITHPRLPSREPETESMAAALAPYRPIHHLSGDARLEGGDVLRVDHTVYVGLSSRTNEEGIAQLAAILEPLGYRVVAVPVTGCLHLKTGGTYAGRNTIVANVDWIDTGRFDGLEVLPVPEDEPWAGNILRIGDRLLLPAGNPRTQATLEERGHSVLTVDIGELQKAEAGLTCCSIVFT